MSRWRGPSFKGAKRTLRKLKRTEADKRAEATKPERRRAYREEKKRGITR